ncbi:hypothetical protein SteCoe_37563 [Stentor coeruleus]|uniref:non-specific serine/threonine protein kinase n=1 Tax=Stentor coeruleus TaxID=5963 RepID=A0A1R2AMR9_9CILI|nr:hypothetical protein SteCoe_37563 [Stentor coeruleus]
MGSICCSSPAHPVQKPHQSLNQNGSSQGPISDEQSIFITPNTFVTKNLAAFSSVYELGKTPLGSGARGEVHICTHKSSGDKRVVKIISKASLPESVIKSGSVLDEVNIMKELDHPNLPRIYEFFEDEKYFYIILEFCKGGDLFEKIVELHKFEEAKAAEIMSQIFSGINYLHSKGIVHRDIKPENVLMDKKDSLTLKIIDFDTATFFGKEKFHEMFGTALFMAPEVVQGTYNEKCDMWSCGIIMYILLSGIPPYDGTEEMIFKALKNVDIKFNGPRWERISSEAKDLLSKLLIPNPAMRISSSEACQHKWILEHAELVSNEDITHVLENIKSFKRSSKLKEAIHTLILSKFVDPSTFTTENKVFELLDENKDGSISTEDLTKIFEKEHMSSKQAKICANHIMEEVDSDMCGKISYSEFLRASVKKNQFLTKENLQQAFNIFDKDGDGIIELEELKKCLSPGAEINKEVLTEIMHQADINGDGKIDIYEFEALLLDSLSKKNSRESL